MAVTTQTHILHLNIDWTRVNQRIQFRCRICRQRHKFLLLVL